MMLELRLLNDNDISLVENWLSREHVKRWYEIPHMGVSISDWIYAVSYTHLDVYKRQI